MPSDWGYKLNNWSPRTRMYLDDVLFNWVNDYHIDGFRFDYTPGVGWDSQSEFGATHYSNMLNFIDPTLILIAEEDNPYQVNVTGFDSGWDYSYHHTLFANIIGVYHEGHTWGDMSDLINHIDAFSQGYNDHTGQLIYSESHDEGRIVCRVNLTKQTLTQWHIRNLCLEQLYCLHLKVLQCFIMDKNLLRMLQQEIQVDFLFRSLFSGKFKYCLRYPIYLINIKI